jgi:hypothetical protein
MRNLNLLRECRAVAGEVGSFAEAWVLPTEIRAWWISEMNREREGIAEGTQVTPDGRRVVRSDVPRGRRE